VLTGRRPAGRTLLAGLLALATGGCQPGAPPPERPLRIALGARPLGLDPHLGGDFHTFSVLANVYDGLTHLDARLRVEPALAERWESPDELTWVFRLRRGVRFHDGRPLTSEDVVFSLLRARDLPGSTCASYLVSVESVRAIDGLTVEVATTRPDPMLLNRLAFALIVPRGAPERIEAPIGTGPYRLLPPADDGPIVLQASPVSWREPARVRRVELVPPLSPDGHGLSPLPPDIDILSVVDPEQLPAVRAAGYQVVTRPGLTTYYLLPGLDQTPFSDLRLRQAVSLALNRPALVSRTLGGFGSPANQLVRRLVLGFDPTLPPLARDLERARTLVAEAGYPEGLDVDLEHRAGLRVTQIAEQLAEAGIRAAPRALPWDRMVSRLRARDVPLYFGACTCNSGADASEVFESMLHSPQPGRGFGDSNDNAYSSPRLDEVIEEAGRSFSLIARRQLLQRGARLASEDLPIIPVYFADDLFGVRPGIEWEPRLDGRVLAFEVTRQR
jgi:peptide/nickel transport system substrate-binding protein